MPRSIDTNASHTHDEALRDYRDHLRKKMDAEIATQALSLTTEVTTPILSEEQREEPHEHIGFGD